jgi:ABC-type iron transport system FetAB permease component
MREAGRTVLALLLLIGVAGPAPLVAGRFQLVVLVGLLAAESVAAVVLLWLLADLPVLPAEAP